MNLFEEIYLNILNEEKSPTTFTPEELLNDVKDKCYYSKGDYFIYRVDDLKKFADNSNKTLFKIFANNIRSVDDYGMVVVYFEDYKNIDKIFSEVGYFHPGKEYKLNFSMNKVKEAFLQFFKNEENIAANFNSIDTYPKLGCVIGINGRKVKTNRDFEKTLDHEINHYFEKMNLKYDLINKVDDIHNCAEKNVLDKLTDLYKIDFTKDDSFIDNVKYHFFDENEFRSMSADVFHEIIRYNESHFENLKYEEFIEDIIKCNYLKYSDFRMKETILFCWICLNISNSRWIILLKGISETISIKKNIFRKFFIKGKDMIRNILI